MQRDRRWVTFPVMILCAAARIAAQAPAGDESKRILGIVPNFRTAPLPSPWVPLSTRGKFNLAAKDTFDRGTIALGMLFGAEGQLRRTNPSFGNGLAAYARYAASSYGDYAIGDYLTDAIYPVMLHQDPRYFRRGNGSGLSRLGYAMGQILRTHNDSGRMAFNYSEVFGNATAVAISNAYYPDSRTAKDAAVKFGLQLAVDAAGNVLKEFWPDVRRRLLRHRDDH